MTYVFSQHSLEQMRNRGIIKETVEKILKNPDQIIKHEDLTIFQGIEKSDQKVFLIRIFMNMKKSPNVVVTVYKTSKIDKYYESKI